MNLFFGAAGVLMILLSIAHALWGEKRVFNALATHNPDKELTISLYVPWHQITFVLLVSGLALVLSAGLPELAVLPYFILAVVAGNFLIFIGICIIRRQTGLFGKTFPQMILFSLLIGLIVLGILS